MTCKIMEDAKRYLEEHAATVEAVKGKRVRVMRGMLIEGEGEAVMRQLACSMAIGVHDRERGSACVFTIAQGPVEVVGDMPALLTATTPE